MSYKDYPYELYKVNETEKNIFLFLLWMSIEKR